MKSKQARRGFTLVEMIVATLLLAIGVVAALGAISASSQSTYNANRAQTAAVLGRQQMEQITLQASSLTAGDQDGNFGTDNPDFHWHETVATTNYQNLYQITLHVQWGAQGAAPHERIFVTYLLSTVLTTPATTSSTNGTTTGATSSTGS